MSEIELELYLGKTMFGGLEEDIKVRLRAVVKKPSDATWENAYSIILNTLGPKHGGGLGGMTLWQAIVAVDPTYPRSGPASDMKGRIESWARIPTKSLLIRALKYATH